MSDECAPKPRAAVDPLLLRATAGRFATGVTVVTAVSEGVEHATTVNAFTSVSLEPPLVLVCLRRTSRLLAVVRGSGTWGVSVLPYEMRALSDRFAARERPRSDQLAGVAHRRGAATGVPLLEGSLAWLECRTSAVHDGGDHAIVVGEVLALGTGESAEDPASAAPLVFYRGGYGSFG